MVERDINWINQRWFNLGIGTESMVELHFTCVDLRFLISRLNPMLRLGRGGGGGAFKKKRHPSRLGGEKFTKKKNLKNFSIFL